MTRLIPTGPVAHIFAAISALHCFRLENADAFNSLTARETEVLALVAQGLSNPDVASELKISRATVQNHRASVREKLDITSEVDYIKFALAYELIRL